MRTDYQGSFIASERARKWVENCDRGHDCGKKQHSCPNTEESPAVPTRLIDVGGREDIIRLVTLGDRQEHYLALSHFWGLSHRLQTMKDNYQSLCDGVHLDELPATFQQAIDMAHTLDIQYIWIDTLCIIQDDPLDWEHEASRMGDVYAHAYLTISALGSADDSSGCFNGAKPDGTNPKAISVQWPFISCDSLSTGRRAISLAAPLIARFDGDASTCRRYNLFGMCGDAGSRAYVKKEWMPSSTKSDPLLCLGGEFGGTVDPFEYEPLNQRAWTLQERLLSPRTLHFGTEEMYWECQHCVFAEDGALLWQEFPTLPKILESMSPSGSGQNSRYRHNAWFILVEEYTKRSLTRDDDKLPALSGLASSIAARTGDTYLAGLWRSNIIEGLSWRMKLVEFNHYCDDPAHDESVPPDTKAKAHYPAKYRAPSWSWASVDGEVSFYRIDKDKVQARCLGVEVMPAGTDKFGKIQLGWIPLEVSTSF